MKRLLLAATMLSALGLISVANANPIITPTISIALAQSPSGTKTVVANAVTGGSASYNSAFGSFSLVNVTAIGSPILPQPTFQTNSIDVKSQTTGDQYLYIYITQQNLTSPTGLNSFLSGFTANAFTGSVVSVDEYSYFSASNALWGGTQLASTHFTGLGSPAFSTPVTLTGTYSETAEFIVHMSGSGSVNDTINLKVPEPVSLSIFGVGMLGLGVISRRRQRNRAAIA